MKRAAISPLSHLAHLCCRISLICSTILSFLISSLQVVLGTTLSLLDQPTPHLMQLCGLEPSLHRFCATLRQSQKLFIYSLPIHLGRW